MPFDDPAVHGDAGPWLHAEHVSDQNDGQRHLDLTATGLDAHSGRGGQAQQIADRAGRAGAGPKLQDLAEQHQRHDHGSGFEVERRSRLPVERARQNARESERDDAEAEGGSDAETDQAEHIEPPRNERAPREHEERPSTPQDDRSCEQGLEPREPRCLADKFLRSRPFHLGHREKKQRERQHGARYEASCHALQLGIRPFVERRCERLERHTTDWTVPRTDLPDLRVHGAGKHTAVGARCRIYLHAGGRHSFARSIVIVRAVHRASLMVSRSV